MTPGYMYAAEIGDYIKIGFSKNPYDRLHGLRNQYKCHVVLLGVARSTLQREHKFHKSNHDFRMNNELYIKDHPCVVSFVAKLKKYEPIIRYSSGHKAVWPHKPKKNVGKTGDPILLLSGWKKPLSRSEK